MKHDLLRFGGFEIDLRAQELRRRGRKLKLGGQPFQVLALLLERPGEVVTREEFRQRLWSSDTFVDFDNGINIAIRSLRQTLGDSAENPKFIETLPRVGYRFISQVEHAEAKPHLRPVEDKQRLPQSVVSIVERLESFRRSAVEAPDQGAALPSMMSVASDKATDSRNDSALPLPLRPWAAAGGEITAGEVREPASRRLLVVVASTAALLALGALAWNFWRRSGSPQQIRERQLTTNSAELPVTAAAISPDGKYIAYADPTGAYVRLIDTGESHPLSFPKGFNIARLAWFPDGSKLLASGRLGQEQASGVWVISILGGAPLKLRDDAGDASASPDGSQVAFVSGGDHEIWLMGARGEEPHKLFARLGSDNLAGPAWSPDGRRLGYVKVHFTPDKSGRVMPEIICESRDLKDGYTTTVLADPRLAGAVMLSGGRVIYSLVKEYVGGGEPSLWEMKTDPRTGAAASSPRQLKNWPGERGGLTSFTASADGKRIALVKGVDEADVYVGELSDNGTRLKNTRRLTLDDRNDFPTAWTPDSKAIFFHSDRNGNLDIFKQGLDQRTAEPIIAGPEDEMGPEAVSPDGLWYFYVVLPRDWRATEVRPLTLMRVRAAGGPSEKVLDKPGLYEVGCVPAPAERCVLSQIESNGLVLYSFDAVHGKGPELAGAALGATSRYAIWDLSPDGSRIAARIPGEGRIRILSLAGEPSREVAVHGWILDRYSPLFWSADGRGWYLPGQSGGGTDLLYVDLEGHAYVLTHMAGTPQTWAVPSPDGRYLAYTQWNSLSNVWMIEGF